LIRARLTSDPLDPAALLAGFLESLGGDVGAVVTFVGLARALDQDGRPVDRLTLDHHPRLTEQSLVEIAQAAAARFDVNAVDVVHRSGTLLPAQAIVWVAAASRHRRAVFEAADYLMDRLKTEAVLWKREDGASGSTWIEPTGADHKDRARWEWRVPGIDESLPFHPLRIAVLTVSDSRTVETDTSGGTLVQRLTEAGHELAGRAIVGDEVEAIRAQVEAWVADSQIDLILSTGGTGFAPRDVTPEAVKPLLRREIDGFAAVFHHASLATVGVATLQSRVFAGQIESTFIFCLPGSTGACRDAWNLVLGLELDSRYRPCSLAGQIPRLAQAGA